MIKFFRKIRQNLLSQGKTGKYFKYALGEIILVVIGILIALQINNLNEKKKTRDKEIIYLINIRIDQIQNLKALDDFISIRTDELRSTEFVLKYFEMDSLVDLNKFNYHNLNVLEWYPFIQNNNTYDELLNTGNLSLISNIEIKNKLQNMQTSYKSIAFVEAEMQQDYERYLYEVFFNSVDFKSSIKNFEEQLSKGQNKSGIKIERNDFESLKKSKLYRNGLSLSDFNTNILIEKYSQMIIQTKELIKLIEDETK